MNFNADQIMRVLRGRPLGNSHIAEGSFGQGDAEERLARLENAMGNIDVAIDGLAKALAQLAQEVARK